MRAKGGDCRKAWMAWFLGAWLVGCGGGGEQPVDPGEASVKSCLNIPPTIAQGVYGCGVYLDDVGNPPPMHVMKRYKMRLYDGSRPKPSLGDSSSPIAILETNSAGFYEFAAATGRYWICANGVECSSVAVEDGDRVKRSFWLSVISFWSDAGL